MRTFARLYCTLGKLFSMTMFRLIMNSLLNAMDPILFFKCQGFS